MKTRPDSDPLSGQKIRQFFRIARWYKGDGAALGFSRKHPVSQFLQMLFTAAHFPLLSGENPLQTGTLHILHTGAKTRDPRHIGGSRLPYIRKK